MFSFCHHLYYTFLVLINRIDYIFEDKKRDQPIQQRPRARKTAAKGACRVAGSKGGIFEYTNEDCG